MTISQLRSKVNAPMRKYHTRLRVYCVRPFDLEHCGQIANTVRPGWPKPGLSCLDWARNLFNWMQDHGIRVRSYVDLSDYLEKCLEEQLLSHVNDVLRSLCPKAPERGLIPGSVRQVPFRHRREWKQGMGYFPRPCSIPPGPPAPLAPVERRPLGPLDPQPLSGTIGARVDNDNCWSSRGKWTMSEMKFGVCLPQYGREVSFDDLHLEATDAEALGYDSVWASDHVVTPSTCTETSGRFSSMSSPCFPTYLP